MCGINLRLLHCAHIKRIRATLQLTFLFHIIGPTGICQDFGSISHIWASSSNRPCFPNVNASQTQICLTVFFGLYIINLKASDTHWIINLEAFVIRSFLYPDQAFKCRNNHSASRSNWILEHLWRLDSNVAKKYVPIVPNSQCLDKVCPPSILNQQHCFYEPLHVKTSVPYITPTPIIDRYPVKAVKWPWTPFLPWRFIQRNSLLRPGRPVNARRPSIESRSALKLSLESSQNCATKNSECLVFSIVNVLKMFC